MLFFFECRDVTQTVQDWQNHVLVEPTQIGSELGLHCLTNSELDRTSGLPLLLRIWLDSSSCRKIRTYYES